MSHLLSAFSVTAHLSNLRHWARALILGCTLALVGCGSLTFEVNGPPPAGPPEGMARIFFVFNQGYPSGRAYITEGTKLLGFVTNNQHFVVDLPAGKHFFMMLSGNDEGLDGEFMAGRTYHIRMYTSGFMGAMYWSPLKAKGEDLETRKEDIEETDLVALHEEEAKEWEEDQKENLEERLESFQSGEDKPSHTVGPEHGL